MSASSCTLQTIAQQETVTHFFLFIVQPIYLHNLSLHTSSQSITSRIYQRLLNPLTYQIAHQGFWIFNWLKLALDSEDGSVQVVRTSVAKNSPSQDSNHPDDHYQSRYCSLTQKNHAIKGNRDYLGPIKHHLFKINLLSLWLHDANHWLQISNTCYVLTSNHNSFWYKITILNIAK